MTHCKRVYGLTGGISTGKSTVVEVLKSKGFKILDADKIAHQVMLKGGPAYGQVVEYFGQEILGVDGEIDREKLGERVFGNREKLDQLNAITHPAIMMSINQGIDEILKEEDEVFVDIPLLFEIEDRLDAYGVNFDQVILVYVDGPTQLKRLMLRDGIDKKQAQKKLDSQIKIGEKLKRTEFVIDNNGLESDLIHEIDRVLEELEK